MGIRNSLRSNNGRWTLAHVVVVPVVSQAGFGNRQAAGQSPDAEGQRCRVRSRLTPSLPSKSGAMWYSVPVPVTRGFETLFTFQVRLHALLLSVPEVCEVFVST